jgi:signal transduction histidine kinase
MAVPIIAGEVVIGVLDVQANVLDNFTADDAQIITTLARQLSVALSNAELYEEQLETAERLREVDRLKSEFLASMSHELRTPLNSIIGYAEVMLDGLDGPLNEEMEEDIAAIHGSGKLLLNLINDILDLAKIEAGQMELELESVNLIEFMEEMIRSSNILVKDKPVEMRLELDEVSKNEIPEEIQADPIRIRQIVNNLLSNAAKFTEDGTITISLVVENGSIHTAITDTGVGMNPEQLDLIFERFRQVDQSSTRRHQGTGLGLDITRRLVHMHGGEIWVSSETGKGSCFTFSLPIHREGMEQAQESVSEA